MQAQRPPRRFLARLRLFPFKRRKRRPEEVTTPDAPEETLTVTLDAVRTALEPEERSADICTPLKSASGGVVGIGSLVDRVDASLADEQADVIYNSVSSGSSDTIPSHQLESIVRSVDEIRDAVRRNESQLSTFTTRLDAFTIGALSSQTASPTPLLAPGGEANIQPVDNNGDERGPGGGDSRRSRASEFPTVKNYIFGARNGLGTNLIIYFFQEVPEARVDGAANREPAAVGVLERVPP
ncbi:hypothetical protein C8R45DRAFT_937477 [Mycena sanguinolenta]|nr:hypothetical protein C8R45DRAFT_937477 [Mycena sanguinolenta]